MVLDQYSSFLSKSGKAGKSISPNSDGMLYAPGPGALSSIFLYDYFLIMVVIEYFVIQFQISLKLKFEIEKEETFFHHLCHLLHHKFQVLVIVLIFLIQINGLMLVKRLLLHYFCICQHNNFLLDRVLEHYKFLELE